MAGKNQNSDSIEGITGVGSCLQRGMRGLSRHASALHLGKAWDAHVYTFVKTQPIYALCILPLINLA